MSKPDNKKAFLYQYDMELAVAFKRDCEDFLEDYERMKSLNYDDFTKIWQSKKFTYVFADQKYALLLKDLTEQYFYNVKKYIMFPKNLYTQIGAFYLLYGLYYKQPLRGFVKIRLTLDEYKKILELIQTLKDIGQYQAVFIFAKMKAEEVFVYTAQPKPLGPEDRFVKSHELYYDDTFKMSKTETAFSKFHELLPNGDLVQRLEQTNREYQEKMQQYAVNHQTPLPFESTIVEDLRQAFFSVQGQSSEVNQENAKEKQTQRSRREVIKDKAMANQNAVYRGLRKIKMATDKDLHKDSDSE